MLSPQELRQFERLAVLVGGFDLRAAEVVFGRRDPDTDLLDVLTGLVDKSLVLAVPHGRTMRYRLLEPVRQYGQERLQEAPGAWEPTRWLHVDHFIAVGEEAEPHLRGGPDMALWLERLRPEQDNLRLALRWCAEHQDAERGLRLGGALWRALSS